MLILWLEREDGGDIDEIRDELFGETLPFLTGGADKAYVVARDGTRTGLAIAHVKDSRFALVFVPPDTSKGFKLIWPNNPEIDLGE